MIAKVRHSTASSPSGALSPKQYNDILGGLVLKSVRLQSAQTKTIAVQRKEQLTVDMSYTADWRHAGKEEVLIVAHCRFAARAKASEKDAVSISADYEILLGSAKKFTDEFFTIYRDLSLPVNVWPYFREFVHNMLGRAGYPPFALPFLFQPTAAPPAPKRKGAKPE